LRWVYERAQVKHSDVVVIDRVYAGSSDNFSVYEPDRVQRF